MIQIRRIHAAFVAFIAFAAFTSSGQNPADWVRVQEEMQRLARKLGQLELRVAALERENGVLADKNERLMARQSGIDAALQSLSQRVQSELASLPQREARIQREVLAEVSKLLGEIEKQLSSPEPAQPAQPSFSSDFPKSGIVYTVQRGDTLSSLADRLGSKVAWIQNANRIERPEQLRAGQDIFIPQQTP